MKSEVRQSRSGCLGSTGRLSEILPAAIKKSTVFYWTNKKTCGNLTLFFNLNKSRKTNKLYKKRRERLIKCLEKERKTSNERMDGRLDSLIIKPNQLY